jgi:DNA-directed RNA polymerase subunit F
MKIAINGEIIETKNILKISTLQRTNIFHSDSGSWEEPYDKKELNRDFAFTITLFNNNYILVEIRPKSINEIRKIFNMYDKIIKIWSENQSDIPQFNI